MRSMSELETKIGYVFYDKELLKRALTHSSYSNELKAKEPHLLCNERLEFFGDSLLSVVTSEYLYRRHTDFYEGDLTRLRAEVVCEEALSVFAKDIELGSFLFLGCGEDKNNGRERKSILADAFEALIAAIYIDASDSKGALAGKQTVEKFVLDRVVGALAAYESGKQTSDYKTRLQQFVQQDGALMLEYVVTDERGPDHMKVFEVEARLGSNVIGKGEGRTKREAEQSAAASALELFGQK